MVAGPGSIWVLPTEGTRLVQVDPAGGTTLEAEHVDEHGRRGRAFVIRPGNLGDDLLRFDAGTGGQERLGRRRRPSPQIALDDGKLWLSSLLSDDAADGGDPASGLECLDLDGRGQFHIESRVRLVRWRLGQVSFSSVDLRPRTPPPGQRGVPAGAGGAARDGAPAGDRGAVPVGGRLLTE